MNPKQVREGAEVENDGFAPWLPLPLKGDHDSFLALIDEHFSNDPIGPELRHASTVLLTGIGDHVAATSDDGYLPMAAWAYLAHDGRHLDPLSLLMLGATGVEPGATSTDVVEQMCSEVNLYQPPALQEIETRSGLATLVRLRRYTGDPLHIDISGLVAVIWMSSILDIAYVMSTTPIDDLVLAADIADSVVPLASRRAGPMRLCTSTPAAKGS